MMHRKNNSSYGFTVIEALALVAMAGLIASISIPQYLKFKVRARQTEARLSLSNWYLAEKNHFAQASYYTPCGLLAGYAHSTQLYAVGIQDSSLPAPVYGAEKKTCLMGRETVAPARISIAKIPPATAQQVEAAGLSMANEHMFLANAVGSVDPEQQGYDVWRVDHSKSFSYVLGGLTQ